MSLDSLISQFHQQGWCILDEAVSLDQLQRLQVLADQLIESPDDGIRLKEGAVYAARNVMDVIPEVCDAWRCDALESFVRLQLGDEAGLVRAMYFDKPPAQTWALPWHKDLQDQ